MLAQEIINTGQLIDSSELRAHFRLRNREEIQKSINIIDGVPDGWDIKKEYKTKKHIFRNKTIGELLEDKVWTLFYNIGCESISSTQFSLVLRLADGIKKTKQIDIAAIDNDIVFVVECKSKESLGKKSLKKEIAEFENNKYNIRNAFKKLLDKRQLQFVFIIATENIIVDDNDKIDADERGTLIWDEYDLLALKELANIAGEGAKYQIYNRVFYNKKIKGKSVTIPAIESKMGGHKYYSFIISPEELLKIAYVHHRTGKSSFLDLSNSYQRMINKNRVLKIEQYIKNGGFFPGGIIINLKRNFQKIESLCDKKHLERIAKNAKPVAITLPPYYGCAWVVDGQHRLYGYADLIVKNTETIPVIAFVEEKSSFETKMFVDINKNQKSIEANLLWDLYEDLYCNSIDEDEKYLCTISLIAKQLNSMSNSPFKNRIAIPKEQNDGNITLTTVCTSIKQNKIVSQDENLLFNDNYEDTIKFGAERIAVFFDIFKTELKDEWDSGDNHYLSTNAGFVVLLGIFRDLIECNLSRSEINNLKKFRKTIHKFLEPLLYHFIEIDNDTIVNYRGAGGALQKSRQIRAELTRVIMGANLGFRSIWLENYEQSLQDENIVLKKKKGLLYYLEQDEGEMLEFKGSLSLDIDRFCFGDRKLVENDDLINEGALKAIVAFLNTKGGTLGIGILEKRRYENKLQEYPVYNDYIIFGIDDEYGNGNWDGYLLKLTELIEKRIGVDVLDQELVRIRKIQFESKELSIIDISKSDGKQYLNNKFYIRRGNKSVLLQGNEIDKYWNNRRKK